MSSNRYANNDRLQRRREVAPGDCEAIERGWETEFQRLTPVSRYDYGRRRHVPSEDPDDAEKRKALEATQSYPAPPSPSARVQFRSALHIAERSVVPSVHLSDYEEIVQAATTPDRWRLSDSRIARGLTEYPAPRPTFVRDFPVPPVQPELEPLPDKPSPPTVTLLDRLLFTAEQKRKDFVLAQNRYEKNLLQIQRRNQWFSELSADRRCYWEYRRKQVVEANEAVSNMWFREKTAWDENVRREKAEWDRVREGYRQGTSSEAVTFFLHLCLDAVPMPQWFERDYNLTFSAAEGILLLDLRIPDFSPMAFVKDRELKTGTKEVPVTIKEKLVLIDKLTTFITIRLMWELGQVDIDGHLKLVACNGFVIRDDPATGLKRNDTILSVVAKPEALASLNLTKIDPVACFRSLKGVSGAKLSELVPVKPLLQLDRHDSRFVASREVAPSADTNLAAMDWQDFEHLIRQLFEKEFGGEGVEVRVTQASRDRGVDAVVFDPHPIRGGKFVIQAKRYTNTVDVSAVRDLYGTVMNEGANRGILVTTSSYGRDSFEFAKDKPITLLSGAELLHLLNKHGHAARIDMNEARQLAKEEGVVGGSRLLRHAK